MGFLPKNKIIKTKKYIVNSFIDLKGLFEIRDLFFQLYVLCVQSLRNNTKTKIYFRNNNFFYYNQAVKFSEIASSYDPHKKVVENVDKVLDQLNIADKFNSFIGKVQLILFILGVIPRILDYEGGNYIIGIVVLLIVILQAYKSLLLFDTETLQLTNQRLVFSKEEIDSFPKKKEELIAAYIWNKSLCKYTCIPSLTLLIIIKTLSKEVYNQVVQNLVRALPDYIPTYIENKSNLKFCLYVIKEFLSGRLRYKAKSASH